MDSVILGLLLDDPGVITASETGSFSDKPDNPSTPVGRVLGDYAESFESTTAGANITTSNTTFASGSPGGDFVGDTSTVYSLGGSRTAKITSTGFGGTGDFNLPDGTTTTYIRWYMNSITLSSNLALVSTFSTSNGYGTQVALNAGNISIYNQTTSVTATNPLTSGQWYRCELDVTASTWALRYYLTESATPVESLSGTTNNVTFNRVRVGNSTGTINSLLVYIDSINGNGTSNPGPLQPQKSASDTGSFTDAVSNILSPKSASETGSFADAGSILVVASASETGALVDAKQTLTTSRTVPDTGAFSENAFYSTFQLSTADAASFREAGSIATSRWKFTPGYDTEIWQVRGQLFVQIHEGQTVLKTAGVYQVVDTPLPEDMAAADIVYLGGRSYPVDDTEMAALTTAGYGSFLALWRDP